MSDDLTDEQQATLLANANGTRLNDLLYDAIEANVPEDVLPGDATTDAFFVMLDNPALVLAALVEAHGLDEVLRALGGQNPVDVTWVFYETETTDVE